MKYINIDPIAAGYIESTMYPGLYANRDGDILARAVHGSGVHYYRPTQHVDTHGYPRFRYNGELVRTHRVVADVYCVRPDGCDQVNHIDGVKIHNQANNIEWCTCRDNITHAFRTGLNTTIGERTKKISDDDVRRIRASQVRTRDLAIMYGCTERNIRCIRSGESRKNVV